MVQGSPEARVRRVCTDSRQLQAGDLFFALRGGRFDGHEFVAEVAGKGAAAIVGERGRLPPGLANCAVIAVEDTRKALGDLAAQYRKDFELPMTAVAGSNGKTTTKELLASVLRQKLVTLWSEASFNNDIGVPLTLLRLEGSHHAAVLEAGTNHPGELAPLVKMIEPGTGSSPASGASTWNSSATSRVWRAKKAGWPSCCRRRAGFSLTATISGAAGSLSARRRQWCGWASRTNNDWRARGVRSGRHGVSFQVDGPDAGFAGEYRIQLLGRHQVVNALFALALGADIGSGPRTNRPGAGRRQGPQDAARVMGIWRGACAR